MGVVAPSSHTEPLGAISLFRPLWAWAPKAMASFPQDTVYLTDWLVWPCRLQLKATGLLPRAPRQRGDRTGPPKGRGLAGPKQTAPLPALPRVPQNRAWGLGGRQVCSATGQALGWVTADLRLITIRTSVYPLIILAQLPKTLGGSLLGLSVVARLVRLTPLPSAPPQHAPGSSFRSVLK